MNSLQLACLTENGDKQPASVISLLNQQSNGETLHIEFPRYLVITTMHIT